MTEKAKRRDSRQAVRKLIRVRRRPRRLDRRPAVPGPVGRPGARQDQASLLTGMAEVLETYADTVSPEIRRLLQNYHLMGMARRVVGVGSVGTSAWVVLLAGADEKDSLVLQAKEATASVLAPFVPGHGYPHQGRRVVEGQRLMQAYGDILLGWKSADVSLRLSPRLLRPAVPRLEGLLRTGRPEHRPAGHLRRCLRLDAGPGPRPFGGPGGHLGLSRSQRPLRRGDRRLRRGVRRQDGEGLPTRTRRSRRWSAHGAHGVTSGWW